MKFGSKQTLELVKEAEKLGFEFVRLSKGSHVVMEHQDNGGRITIGGSSSSRNAKVQALTEMRRVAEGRAAA